MKQFKIHDIFTVKYDKNGNTIISISGKCLGVTCGVWFQLGSLGITSRQQLFSMSFDQLKQSIFDYVKEHGTDRQKYLFFTETPIQLDYIIKGVIRIQYKSSDDRRDIVCFRTLNETLLDHAVDTLCDGCRHKNKKLFRQCLSYAVKNKSGAQHYAARATVIENHVCYSAGQSYPDELREFRKAVIY